MDVEEVINERKLLRKYILISSAFLAVMLLGLFIAVRMMETQQNQAASTADPVALRKLPAKNMLVYTKYDDKTTKESSGFIYVAELGNPDSVEKVYNFKVEETKSSLSKIIGVADRKVAYILEYPQNKTVEIGYVDLVTSLKTAIATTRPNQTFQDVFIVPDENLLYYRYSNTQNVVHIYNFTTDLILEQKESDISLTPIVSDSWISTSSALLMQLPETIGGTLVLENDVLYYNDSPLFANVKDVHFIPVP